MTTEVTAGHQPHRIVIDLKLNFLSCHFQQQNFAPVLFLPCIAENCTTSLSSFGCQLRSHAQFTDQLDEKLCLDPPRGLVLLIGALREKRVDLVDEDHGWLMHPGHGEEGADHLLAFTNLEKGIKRCHGAHGCNKEFKRNRNSMQSHRPLIQIVSSNRAHKPVLRDICSHLLS